MRSVDTLQCTRTFGNAIINGLLRLPVLVSAIGSSPAIRLLSLEAYQFSLSVVFSIARGPLTKCKITGLSSELEIAMSLLANSYH